MAFTLNSATVPVFRQTLGAVAGLLDKGEAFCAERTLAPVEIVQARLAPDMFPFAHEVAEALTALGAVAPAEIDAFVGRDAAFEFRPGLRRRQVETVSTPAIPADARAVHGRAEAARSTHSI